MTEPAGWQQYAALLRELDRLRLEQEQVERSRAERAEVERVEAERAGPGGPAGGPGGGVPALRAELVRVEAALDDQADQLNRLARLLRLRRPALAPAPASSARGAWGSAKRGTATPPSASAEAAAGAPSADPFVLLEQAVGQAQRSADLANQAERQARRPRLLPALAAGPRNVLVYLVTALLGLAVQYPIVQADPNNAPFAVVLVLVPAVTFGLGWLVITLFGRSRLVSAAERARVGAVAGADPRRRSVRVGLMICFLAFPALFAVLLVTGRLTR